MIQALTDFLCSNKIEILNVAGPRDQRSQVVTSGRCLCCAAFLIGALGNRRSPAFKNGWTLIMLRSFLNLFERLLNGIHRNS